MERLLCAKGMVEADSYAIKTLGIPELILMEHAALAVVKALEDRFGSLLGNTSGLLVAGPGNNGGDALAVARILYLRGVKDFSVVLLGTPGKLSRSCQTQAAILKKLGIKTLAKIPTPSFDWVIDGIFGTGLNRAPQGIFQKAIEAINKITAWKIAIDLPSGLDADTGMPLGSTVKTNHTVTFGFIKQGLLTGLASDWVGKLSLAPLQIPRDVSKVAASALWFDQADAKLSLPRRPTAGHKGTFGHVHHFLGVADKEGASAIALLASLRTGAGLATLVGESAALSAVRPRMPREMMTEVYSPTCFADGASRFFAIGPGFGITEERWEILEKALSSSHALVLDADALTLISGHLAQAVSLLRKRKALTVLTPHPKEASRLLGKEVTEIQADRFFSVCELAKTFSCWAILKGKGTLVAGPTGVPMVVTRGNTALAKAGSGDLLTGVVTSLLAQGLPPEKALPLAVFLQGRAAELLSDRKGTERSSTASEIADSLPAVFSELES